MTAGIVVIVIVVLMAFSGYRQGAIYMLFSLISSIIAFIGARVLVNYLPEDVPAFLTFPVSFIIMGMILMAVARALRLVDRIPLVGFVNNILGLVLGALVGFALVMIVLYLIDLLAVVPSIAEFSDKYLKDDQIIQTVKSFDYVGFFNTTVTNIQEKVNIKG